MILKAGETPWARESQRAARIPFYDVVFSIYRPRPKHHNQAPVSNDENCWSRKTSHSFPTGLPSWVLWELKLAMTTPAFYILPGAEASQFETGLTSSVNTIPSSSGLVNGSVISPPKTHDTSRIGWHMQDLECLSKYIETVSYSCYRIHLNVY